MSDSELNQDFNIIQTKAFDGFYLTIIIVSFSSQ